MANSLVSVIKSTPGHVLSEVGISQALGQWTLEGIAGVTFYTKNDDFLSGKTRGQDPIYSLQGYLIYDFPLGIWAALNATYYTGGRTGIDGVEGGDLQRNWRLGATLTLPVNRHNSVRLYASTGVQTRTGGNLDLLGIAWQYRWGGRPLTSESRFLVHFNSRLW
jgi:hypothetical protein